MRRGELSLILLLILATNGVLLVNSGFYKVSECEGVDCPGCEPGYWGTKCEFCRLRMTADSGKITDGPKTYKESSKCTWLIETSKPNSTIELSLKEFATECTWDHLYVFAGNSIQAPLLGTLSGLLRDKSIDVVANEPIRNLSIKSNKAFLYFYSDANYILNGFDIQYKIKNDCSMKCSNHGQCDSHGNCACETGWTGSSCNITTCATSCVSGTCNAVTRQCEGCKSGFTGPSCNVTVGQEFWTNVPANNQDKVLGRASHTSGVIGEWLWIYGGYSLQSALPFDDLVRYHIPTNTWEVVELLVSNPAPSRRYGHSMVVYNETLVIYGGTTNGGKVTNELWSFDTISRQWSQILPDSDGGEPIAVSGHTANLVGNKMLVIFGYGPKEGYTQKVQQFDLVSKTWTIRNVNPWVILATFGHSSSYDPVEGKIYVFGGYRKTTEHEIFSNLSVYIPTLDKWHTLLSSGYRRFLHTSVLIGNLLVVFGGNTHNDTNSSAKKARCFSFDAFMYDTRCNIWRKLPAKSVTSINARYGHTATQVNGTMYVFGGFQGLMLNDILTYTPGDCSAYKNRTSCLAAYSLHGCVRHIRTGTCIGPQEAQRLDPSSVEKPVCPANPNRCSTFTSCNQCESSLLSCKWCGKCEDSNSQCTEQTCPTAKSPNNQYCGNDCGPSNLCSNHSSCERCTADKNCIWCESQKQCVGLNAYVMSFPYGQCQEWTKDKCTDVRCEDRKMCNDCHTLPGCGWCDDGSGTGLGKCIGGGDDGPFLPSSNSSIVPADRCLPKGGKKRWFFVECPVCQCNGHSTCDRNGKCISCKHHSNGTHCQTCGTGYYGDAKNGGRCHPCQCNGHGATCQPESGVCNCQTKGVTGNNCELCETRKTYYGNSTNGGHCYYNLTSGYMFTFNVTGYTGISFLNVPLKDDRSVMFSIKVIGDGALVNMSYKYRDSTTEQKLFSEKYLDNSGRYESSFKHDEYEFGTKRRLTFYVYVYNVNGNCMIEISFSQISPFQLLKFFLTFFGCFFSILMVTFIAWKVRVRYNWHVMRQQRLVEMHQMAKRPSSTLRLCIEKHNGTYVPKTAHNPVTVQPFANSNAAAATFVLRMPSLPNGLTPLGQTGICFGSVLIDHRTQLAPTSYRCYTFQKGPDKRRLITQCI